MILSHIILGASPPTGDSFPTWPLLILILAALAIITFVILKRQNKKAAAADFAQIDLEADVPDTVFAEKNTVNFVQAKEENGYDGSVSDDGEADDYYDEEIDDAYEDEQRNFEMKDDENDGYGDYDDDDDDEY